ncbi:MAG: helix-turn-helix domain-containing protein [Cyanobacteriota bacterium]
MSAELIPELQRLGQRLEQARQAQGISRENQAERLHMGTEQLRALEQGDHQALPESVFVVAQARRVAASLGLNIDPEIAALRDNPSFQPQPSKRTTPARTPPPTSPPTAQPAQPAASGSAPARGMGPLAAASALVLAVAAALFWGQQRGALTLAPEPRAPTPESALGSSPASPINTSQPAQQGPDHLLLRASQPSWIEVRNQAGAVLFRGTLQGEQRFPLDQDLRVLAGRPDLVLVSQGSAPAQPLGPIEAVTWRRFSPAPAP